MKRPAYLINGFLESGKTDLIKFTIQNDKYYTKGETLLLVCEEGIEEYDKRDLEGYFTHIVKIEDFKDFNPDNIDRIVDLYDPDRVIIEYNGMWDMKENHLPVDLVIKEQITMIDATTFTVYFNNMRELFVDMVRNSDVIIFNRADDHSVLGGYRRTIKTINPNANIVFEDKNGRIEEVFDEDLPYDIKSDEFEIKNEDFGIFYVDSLDQKARYENKKVTISGMAVNLKGLDENELMIGRMAMTCCEADMSYFGVICHKKPNTKYKGREFYRVTGTIKYQYSKYFQADGPVLYIEESEDIEEIKEVLTIS